MQCVHTVHNVLKCNPCNPCNPLTPERNTAQPHLPFVATPYSSVPPYGGSPTITQVDRHNQPCYNTFMAKPLSDIQKAAVRELLKMEDKPNKKQAMLLAGYSESAASSKQTRLFDDPRVLEYMGEVKRKRERDTGLSSEYIIKRLMRIESECLEQNDYAGATRALELLGKHLAMWTDKNVSQLEVKNPFASGDEPSAIVEDIGKLHRVLGNLKDANKRAEAAPSPSAPHSDESPPVKTDVAG